MLAYILSVEAPLKTGAASAFVNGRLRGVRFEDEQERESVVETRPICPAPTFF